MKSILMSFMGLFLVSDLAANEISSIRKLASTCLRIAGHRSPEFVVVDRERFQPTRISVGWSDLVSIARDGTIIRGGVEIPADRANLINPRNRTRIKREINKAKLQSYRADFFPTLVQIEDFNQRLSSDDEFTTEDYRNMSNLLAALLNQAEAKSPGYFLSMINFYSSGDEFSEISIPLQGFIQMLRRHLTDRSDSLQQDRLALQLLAMERSLNALMAANPVSSDD